MKLNRIAKKTIAIFSVLLLILSLKISTNVTAELVKDYDYGVAFDEFEDNSSIIMENCTVNETIQSVILKYEPLSLIYNHNKKPNNIEGWYDDQPFFVPGGDLLKILTALTNPNILEKYEFTDLTPIDSEDSSYLETESIANLALGYVYYPINLFKIQIDENIKRLDTFSVSWIPGPYNENANVEEITMYLWSFGDYIPRWNNIGICEYTQDNFNSTKGEISSEEKATKYISSEGFIYILIVAKPIPNMDPIEPAFLTTNYVEVELSVKEGYNPNGYVISDIISPQSDKFNGWESIIWDSSRPTEESYVKIQILDTSNIPLSENELVGNINGFSTSPIDLSSLGVSRSQIRLKAILHSAVFDITPRLYSWAVLWQTTQGFFDSFTYDFRIGTSNGVEIENGDIKISKFYSEWPMFGKNPANTRSYVGLDVEYEGNKTYWQSYINKDVGGWFYSPVLSDGHIFIGSNDKKIYAFNLSYDPIHGIDSEYSPSDESSANYPVETSVAVSDEYVVFGTNELKSKNNKIYALNSSDLSNRLWSYSINNDNTICYSASPTIANGNIYITSWSGQYSNNMAISYLFSKFNTIFSYKLGLNNKLIALDLKSGNQIWDPIDLPAASLSTPAVDDGMIFVGCENIGGPSIFAYDEDMGTEIWNVSVGTIGRAAPVVTEGENGKIVIVVTREQKLFSFQGTDKVVALNAENGTVLWNFTIGNESTLLRSQILKLDNFTNTKATEPPAATPAVFGNIVYVMSSNGKVYALDINTGEEKWVFEDSSSNTYHSASPVIVNNIVYILSQGANLYELNAQTGETLLNYEIVYEGYSGFLGYCYGSPIVSDGLAVVSIMDWRIVDDEYFGHLICLGKHTSSSIGNVYSKPIHVQKSKWWDKFDAVKTNTTKNTITFSILDENGNELMTGLNGINNNISGIKVNIIRLCANLSIGNTTEAPPVLESWKISWNTEDKKPEFIDGSFRAGGGQEGWVNLDLSECSIQVKDIGVGSITSGIDTSSAKYLLEYVKKGSNTVVSEWYNAVCDKATGALQTTVTAKISEDLKNVEITDLRNITFSIKDLAGNENTSKITTLKIDSVKPTSEIKDKDSFDEKYNTEVLISAQGSDDKSGVVSIALYYRVVGKNDWLNREQSNQPPYDWLFKNNTSDEYEFCTIATDKAGNIEDFPDDGDVSFLLDINKPSKPEFKDEYRFNKLPKLTGIIFKDDYKLTSVEYRLNFQGTNEWTNISKNINNKNYTGEWSLSQDVWDIMLEDERYYIYFKVTDFCGNQYITPKDNEALNITKDITAPVVTDVTLELFNFEQGGWDDAFTIRVDVPSDTEFDYIDLEYSYSSDNIKWGEWVQFGDSIDSGNIPYEWDFKANDGSGYYKFKTTLWDTAGNYIESPEEIVNITLFPIGLVALMIFLIFILFIATVYTIKKMKKKKE